MYVASTNVFISAGFTPITPNFDFNIYTPRENLTSEGRELLRQAGNASILPPWAHFAALKTYITAVADVGLLSLLRRSYPDLMTSGDAPSNDTIADMHRQCAWGLHAIAPSSAEAVFRDLATEFFDKHPMDLHAWLKLMDRGPSPFEAEEFIENLENTSDPQEKLLGGNFDDPTLIFGFRHSGILDKAQDHIFSDPEYFAQVQVLAPTMP